MSTSYYFKCLKCNEVGGQYTRQAWGWGNLYVIETFKFLAYHTEHCGPESICVIHEGQLEGGDIDTPESRIAFIEKTREYFPHFETQYRGKDINGYKKLSKEWYKYELKEAKDLYDYVQAKKGKKQPPSS
jgi:hypothetical protein